MRDLIVAGGGPVGLATALYAARAGLDVAVLEPRDSPIDKACGEGLMPGAVAALRDLDVKIEGQPLRGIRYTDGIRSATAPFANGPGYGVRRTALHSALAAAVREAGVPVLPCAVNGLVQDPGGVSAGGLRARYLAAADGLHSPIRRRVGLERPASPARRALPARYGLRRHFAVPPWSDFVEVHWGSDVEAYVTPVSADLVGVALLTSRRAPYEIQLTEFPALAERLPATAATPTRGAGPLRQRAWGRAAGRVLLVGDAAGYVDALTGEGISVGLASARALVDCVCRDDTAAYEREWLLVSRRYRWITSTLLQARSYRRSGALIVLTAKRLPSVFTAAVNQLAK